MKPRKIRPSLSDRTAELRTKVEVRRLRAESYELRAEMNGRNIPVDPKAIYETTKTLAKATGLCHDTVSHLIRQGDLAARKTGKCLANTGGGGACWAVHPKDAKRFVEHYKRVRV